MFAIARLRDFLRAVYLRKPIKIRLKCKNSEFVEIFLQTYSETTWFWTQSVRETSQINQIDTHRINNHVYYFDAIMMGTRCQIYLFTKKKYWNYTHLNWPQTNSFALLLMPQCTDDKKSIATIFHLASVYHYIYFKSIKYE